MKRRLAREMAVQSLYFMAMNEVAAQESVEMVLNEAVHEREEPLSQSDVQELSPFVHTLVEGTSTHLAEIDGLLEQYLRGWKVERLSKVDLQILRLAVFEMFYDDEVPPKVAINEAIDLAKWFGTDDSGKFINGVLGKMIHQLDEIKQSINR